MMQDRKARRAALRSRRGYPLNIVGLGQVFCGEQVRRTEMFGCESVLLAEGPMAARATVLRGARGILLRRDLSRPGETWYELAVAYADGRPATILQHVSDDAAVIAHWRRAGLELGLPLLVEDLDGSVTEACGKIGSVLLGTRFWRRPLRAQGLRRPRFLARRKTGRLPDRPVVRREREIIARS